MASVGIVTMATGRYQSFLPQLVESAARHVVNLQGICVLSDGPPATKDLPTQWLPWGHFPWPYPTLLRYRAMSNYASILRAFDVVLYTDVDMHFVGSVDVSSAVGLVAVEHPGYVGQTPVAFPYERRPESTAFIRPGEGRTYFCGGVQGGVADAYLEACDTLALRIEDDLARQVVATWHDESAWNRYCLDFPPQTVLSSDYCTPDTARRDSSRILALSKDHSYFREESVRQRLASTGLKLTRYGRAAARRLGAFGMSG